ncbi:MAG: glycosyltransferase, partial [Glaciimonas sp.]|nr:glycosyltransferase [Glaciimonas sp.]
MSTMRLLIIHSSADLYGSDKSLLDFVSHTDHIVTVVVPCDGPLIAELRAAGATVFIGDVCKIQREMFSPLGFLELIRAAYRSWRFLGRIHQSAPFDLFYSNTVAVFGGALTARLCGVPHIWHVREIMSTSRTLSAGFRFLVDALSTQVVCNSGETLAWIRPSGPKHKYHVIWNGFDASAPAHDRSTVRAAMDVATDEVLFVLVGRINRWKGQKLLVQAFSQLDAATRHKCKLAIVGSAPAGQEHFESAL